MNDSTGCSSIQIRHVKWVGCGCLRCECCAGTGAGGEATILGIRGRRTRVGGGVAFAVWDRVRMVNIFGGIQFAGGPD